MVIFFFACICTLKTTTDVVETLCINKIHLGSQTWWYGQLEGMFKYIVRWSGINHKLKGTLNECDLQIYSKGGQQFYLLPLSAVVWCSDTKIKLTGRGEQLQYCHIFPPFLLNLWLLLAAGFVWGETGDLFLTKHETFNNSIIKHSQWKNTQ